MFGWLRKPKGEKERNKADIDGDEKEIFSAEQIEWLKRYSVVNLRPGDIIIFNHPGCLSESAYRNLKESTKVLFEGKYPLHILEEGMQLGVLHLMTEASKEGKEREE